MYEMTSKPLVKRTLATLRSAELGFLGVAKLNVAPDKMEKLVADMQDLVVFVEQLNALDTSGTAPLMHMGDAVNVLRADEVNGSISREAALQNAPESDGVFFKVPKVINK